MITKGSSGSEAYLTESTYKEPESREINSNPTVFVQ